MILLERLFAPLTAASPGPAGPPPPGSAPPIRAHAERSAAATARRAELEAAHQSKTERLKSELEAERARHQRAIAQHEAEALGAQRRLTLEFAGAAFARLAPLAAAWCERGERPIAAEISEALERLAERERLELGAGGSVAELALEHAFQAYAVSRQPNAVNVFGVSGGGNMFTSDAATPRGVRLERGSVAGVCHVLDAMAVRVQHVARRAGDAPVDEHARAAWRLRVAHDLEGLALLERTRSQVEHARAVAENTALLERSRAERHWPPPELEPALPPENPNPFRGSSAYAPPAIHTDEATSD